MPYNPSEKSFISSRNIFYYDQISREYNQLLDKDDFNKNVRKAVSDKFRDIVEPCLILDFGGGTGMDLYWLTNNNYQVIFCEPSKGMRDEALSYVKNNLPNNNIRFLDDSKCDFSIWDSQPPFEPPVNAILSNFAVINCISNIDLLFKNLASVMNPNGHLIVLILEYNFKKLLRFKFRSLLKSFLFRKPVQIQVEYKENWQTVYIYSIKEIKKASINYFEFYSSERMNETGFTLIHLVRK